MRRRYFDADEVRRDLQGGTRRTDMLTQLRHTTHERGSVARTDPKSIDYAAKAVIYPAECRRRLMPMSQQQLPMKNLRVKFFLLRTGTVGTSMSSGTVTRIVARANEILRPAFVTMLQQTNVDPFEVPEFMLLRGTKLTHTGANDRAVKRAMRSTRLRGQGTLNVVVVRDLIYPDRDVAGSHMPGADFVFLDQRNSISWAGRVVVHEMLHRLGRDHVGESQQGNIMYEGSGRRGVDLSEAQIREIRNWATSPSD